MKMVIPAPPRMNGAHSMVNAGSALPVAQMARAMALMMTTQVSENLNRKSRRLAACALAISSTMGAWTAACATAIEVPPFLKKRTGTSLDVPVPRPIDQVSSITV